jgi:NADP-dependent 3-hydroxy acid dehydrogenase YdfG
MQTLEDKVVVITGAASGIGRALAVEVARRGARVAISDVDEDGLSQTVDLVKDAGAHEVRSDRLDVADRAAFAGYAGGVADHFGRVDVVVNNAGVALVGDVEDLDYADMDWITGINFWGVVHGTKEFLPHLIASGDGHLVNMSSLFGLMACPSQSMYNAAKHAVRGFSEALREELLIAGHPVGVTVVHPGGVQTGIVRNARTSAREDHDRITRLFETKMARTSPEDAARLIIEKGVLGGKPRLLVGRDAHLLHQFARLTGARYQDVVAFVAKRTRARTR